MKNFLVVFFLTILITVNGYAENWMSNYQAALVKGKQEQKLILLNVTGSDWCAPCQLLEKEVFSTSEFKAFIAKNFIPVTIDFPAKLKLSADLTQQNEALQKQFAMETPPTLIVITAEGKEIGRVVGYKAGNGPQMVINQLRPFLKK